MFHSSLCVIVHTSAPGPHVPDYKNDVFIKASGKIIVSVPEIKFVSKIKGDATTLISLNPLTTVHFCSLKIHHRYD